MQLKLDGRWFGAPPTSSCGLCVPCMVRRATFPGDVPDGTTYVVDLIAFEDQRRQLIEARRGDAEAVKYAVAGIAPMRSTRAPGPPGYDLDRVGTWCNAVSTTRHAVLP